MTRNDFNSGKIFRFVNEPIRCAYVDGVVKCCVNIHGGYALHEVVRVLEGGYFFRYAMNGYSRRLQYQSFCGLEVVNN